MLSLNIHTRERKYKRERTSVYLWIRVHVCLYSLCVIYSDAYLMYMCLFLHVETDIPVQLWHR